MKDYEILYSYHIQGITEDIAKKICDRFGLILLPDLLDDDRETFLMNLLDIGIDIETVEALFAFIEHNFISFKNI